MSIHTALCHPGSSSSRPSVELDANGPFYCLCALLCYELMVYFVFHVLQVLLHLGFAHGTATVLYIVLMYVYCVMAIVIVYACIQQLMQVPTV